MNETPKTPEIRGWRTFVQALGGILVGLVLAVWNVPGVPEVITEYARTNFVPLFIALATLIGIPSGIISLIQNRIEAANK